MYPRVWTKHINVYLHALTACPLLCRIMVLSDGLIVEFDSPNQLLATKGVFYGMAKDAGLT